MTDEILRKIDELEKIHDEGFVSSAYKHANLEDPVTVLANVARVAINALLHIEGLCDKIDNWGVCDCPNTDRTTGEYLKEIATILGVKEGEK